MKHVGSKREQNTKMSNLYLKINHVDSCKKQKKQFKKPNRSLVRYRETDLSTTYMATFETKNRQSSKNTEMHSGITWVLHTIASLVRCNLKPF